MLDNRGAFKIPAELYYKEPEILQQAFADIGFLPYRVEMMAMLDKFELQGCSKEFRKIAAGEHLPEYILEITKNDDDEYESAKVLSA